MVGELGMVWQQGKNGWETRLEQSENSWRTVAVGGELDHNT